MNNMQTTTPGFVLTSLSFKQTENNKKLHWQQPDTERHSSIAKFDYCLPPEDLDEPAGSKKHEA